MANVELTGNFLATARCLIFADSSTGVWSFNPNTNTLTITAAGGGTGFANPTATVGLTAVNGSATTMMRSDAAPALSSSIYSSLNVVSTLCYRDSNGNVHANNFESAINGNVATGTITLTNASARIQTFTSGSGSAIVILPDATTLHVGHTIELDNNASGNLTVQLSGTGTTFLTMLPGSYLVMQCTSISFQAGQWNYYWTNPVTNQGLVQDSIVLSSGVAQLSGDSASPGNSHFYGTNGSGTKGWYASPVGANPSATIGLAAINGTAVTFMTSDSAPALSQAIVPTWTGLHTFSAGLTISAGAFTLNGHTLTLTANASVSGTNTGDQTLPVGANPTGTIGLAAVNGSATTWMRSDGAPALSQAIVPTWTGLHTFSAGLTISAGAFTLNGHTLTLTANASVSGTNTGDQTIPTGANPSTGIGLAVVNGVATTFMRSDGAPALSQSIVPTWTGFHIFTGASATYNSAFQAGFGSGSGNAGIVLLPGAAGTAFLGMNNAANGSIPVQLNYNFNTNVMQIVSNSADVLDIASNGNITVQKAFAINAGTPTAALTGFGTPSGTPTASLTNAATLAQTAGTLAALLAYLKTIGFIAA